jgi:serine protease Do
MRLVFSTRKVCLCLLLILFLGGMGGILLERVLFPYLSSWSIFKNVNFLRPETQLVITRREEVRIDEGINQQELASRVKNSLVTVYCYDGELGEPKFQLLSKTTGIIAANDGLIVVPLGKTRPKASYAMAFSSNHEVLEAGLVATDEKMGLAFLKVEKQNLSVIKQGFSEELSVGERLVAVWTLDKPSEVAIKPVTLARKSSAIPSLLRLYDFDGLNASVSVEPSLEDGELGTVVVGSDGSLVGFLTQIDSEKQILRAEDLKLSLDHFLNDGRIIWPKLALSYQILGETETAFLGLPKKSGIMVVSAATPLRANDFIYSVDGTDLASGEGFQERILRKAPGEKVKLRLLRNQKDLEVEITLQ